jgi:asparagine synthase (glutamine-hydrolysing)
VKSFERFPTMLWHNEDPTAYALEVPRFALAEASSRHCKVVLTGEGSDEVLGGYARFLYDPWLRMLSAVPAPLRRLALAGGVLPRRHPWAARMLFAPREPASARYELLIAPHGAPRRGELYAGDVRAAVDAAPEREEWAEPPGEDWHPFDRLQRHELTTCMADFIVPTLDRGSMAHGVEARVPFLDHELVELCMQIPPWQKVHALTEKRVLREALRGIVPEDVRVRRKWGLRAPIASWMRPPLPRFASELLSVDALRAKGYFEPSAVQAVLTRHQAGAAELRSQIQAILAVQVWDEMFVRGRDPRDLS